MYKPKAENPVFAALLIIVACAFIAASTLFAKALGTDQFGEPLHPFQISFGRFLFAFIVLGMAALALKPELQRPHLGFHLARTTCGWAGVTLMFASVAYIPLADATAISFLNPVFGMILAIPLLGERVGKWRWLAALIAFLGAMILLRPTPESFQPAALLALGAALALGFELSFIKKLTGREGPFSILLANNALGLCIAGVAVSFVWQSPSNHQWALMAGVGCSMASAQACFVNAMARADASFVAPFSYATLIFAAGYDIIFYRVIPDAVTILGAGVIIAGALLLAWREGLHAKPKAQGDPL
ncbi:DMT transporter permease [Tateyamaria omphalii]|uniref:DMT family transporter n=1 Tax=Tateyamaria omphalii TaxID=299262 RepID=UPI00167438D7|nr:DMT family transporter [Tateyamaria omphalii]GGX59942.1 DMT transporter permease [Tateyamaria omphalii]